MFSYFTDVNVKWFQINRGQILVNFFTSVDGGEQIEKKLREFSSKNTPPTN